MEKQIPFGPLNYSFYSNIHFGKKSYLLSCGELDEKNQHHSHESVLNMKPKLILALGLDTERNVSSLKFITDISCLTNPYKR